MPKNNTCSSRLPTIDAEEMVRVADVLGPMPRETLVAMIDYGLNDDEIGRYFKIRADSVRSLRQYFDQR